MIAELIWERDFDGRFEERDHAIETFERHNEEVEQRVPPERLLVYEVKEGWGPVCDFLGVEVPDQPFPHLNDTEAFRGWVRRMRLLITAALTIGVLLTGLVVLRFSRRRRHCPAWSNGIITRLSKIPGSFNATLNVLEANAPSGEGLSPPHTL
jgi:hypothetical protein